MTWTETVAVIRDIAIIALTLITSLVVLVVFFKVTALVDSLKRIVKGVEDVTSTIAGTIGSAGAGAGFFAGITRAASMFVGSSDREDTDR